MDSHVPHIALVCNPTHENEKALGVMNRVKDLLTFRGISFEVFDRTWPAHFGGFTSCWIMGGDGTLNRFINAYPGVALPLSVFKGGSGNDFHWMLYGDAGVEEQVVRVLRGHPRAVDAGSCNGQLFLNGVGIGFDGAIVHDLLGKKKLAGKASYLLSVLKNIISYHEKHYLFEIGEDGFGEDCLFISVANARRYGGGFQVAPGAEVNDGLLDVNIVGKIPPLKRMRYLPVIEKGEHIGLPFVQYRRERRLLITAAQPSHAHIDGEYVSGKRFEIEILPGRFSFIY